MWHTFKTSIELGILDGIPRSEAAKRKITDITAAYLGEGWDASKSCGVDDKPQGFKFEEQKPFSIDPGEHDDAGW